MGWDAFGLPAENYAIKTGTHPRITTEANINRFREQLKMFGFSFDWNREVDTTNPEYYKWSQWIFLKMFEAGLAYEAEMPVNWCPALKAVLANEEVIDGKSEIGGHPVEKKNMRQWILAITKYADRLLADIDRLDWPEGIKEMQRNWIGKSEGCQFAFKWIDCPDVAVFTTRIDTVFGVTYVVVAPDHPNVEDFITEEHKKDCNHYIKHTKKESDLERTNANKEKTGVFTGSYVVNPFNDVKLPVWIADYVLGHYGTGAVMAVPGHDTRDWEFSKKYDLQIVKVVASPEENLAYDKLDAIENKTAQDFDRMGQIEDTFSDNKPLLLDGFLIKGNAWRYEELLWLSSSEARDKFAEIAEKEWFWKKVTNYKLRDWIFSRQRYWGEPIPVIHIHDEDLNNLPNIETGDLQKAFPFLQETKIGTIEKGWPKNDYFPKAIWECFLVSLPDKSEHYLFSVHTIDSDKKFTWKFLWKLTRGLTDWLLADWDLPLKLPEVEKYEPSGDGRSPLATIPEWVHVQIGKNLVGYRETNTMPQWAGSCWYYLRFMDPTNSEAIVDPKVVKYWGEVDSYIGGAEHAVLHLLYSRFWHKFLFDIKVVPTDEPFFRLRNVGLILWPDGNKMSKSRWNVINPDDVIGEYWADTLRLYEMSMADFSDVSPWNTNAIVGSYRLLEKIYRLFSVDPTAPEYKSWTSGDNLRAAKTMHKTIKKVGEDIENMKFNTAIAAITIMVNEGIPTDPEQAHEWKSVLVRLVQPFAPHMAEECWSLMGNEESVYFTEWPDYIPAMTIDDEVQIAIQINGKLRGTYPFLRGVTVEEVRATIESKPEIAKWLEGSETIKEVFIPNKILNIVVK